MYTTLFCASLKFKPVNNILVYHVFFQAKFFFLLFFQMIALAQQHFADVTIAVMHSVHEGTERTTNGSN
jgi:hypothetical protein